ATKLQYEDKLGKLSWEILSGTDTVAGYACQKAQLKFRGRTYTAWFSTDIPINEGPWKFSGLPGLILKAEDTDQLFSFTLIGMMQPKTELPLLVTKSDYLKCTREEFNKQLTKRGMGMGGRFPVRPSISGIENFSDNKSESPSDNAPPIPKRSHARVSSGTLGLQLQRPGVAPLLQSNGETNRSRSDTVSSLSSIRARRQGYVPSKRTVSSNTTNTDLNAVSETASQDSSRSSQVTIKAPHSRNPSIASTYNGYLAPNGSGETSSGAASPIDGPIERYNTGRGSGNVMIHPNAKLLKSQPILASRRLLFTLMELQRPLVRIAQGLKDGTPKRTMLEGQLFNANAHVEELDRLLHDLDSGVEDTPKREAVAARRIAQACDNSLRAYGTVVKELKGFVQKIAHVIDPILVRCLMFQINMNHVRYSTRLS
ncbi:MAG: GLPGLI family protein, partial [Cytophagaceae bacterium]